MKYFANLTVIYTAKNQAHKAIQQYAINNDGTLLVSEKVKHQFIKRFEEKIAEINKQHTRCKDIQLSGYTPPIGASHSISVYSNFTISIYPVKHDTTLN